MYIDLPFLLIYVSLSGLLLVHDLRTGLLPDKFTCPLLWGGLVIISAADLHSYPTRFGVP